MARWTQGRKVSDALHIESIVPFYVVYIALAGITFFIWVLAWFLWAIFLATAAYHFGKKTPGLSANKLIHHEILFFFKGAAVIAAPFSYTAETLDIFLILNLDLSMHPLVDERILAGAGRLTGKYGLGRKKSREVQALLISGWCDLIQLACSHFSPSFTFVCFTPFDTHFP